MSSFFRIILFSFLALTLLLSSCGRPLARFEMVQVNPVAPSKVQFENKSKRAESYHWDFGDGKVSENEQTSHIYFHSGNYEVNLTAKKAKRSHTLKKYIHVEAPKTCQVVVETKFGNMVFELSDLTPKHRDNFIELTEKAFFDDLLFHRVIKSFMIQGGDPESRNASPTKNLGGGGPGYQIPAEFNEELIHVKGALAAARMGDQVNPEKKSSGSQFYIVQGGEVNDNTLDRIESRTGLIYTDEQRSSYLEMGGTPFLDGQYTVFGKMISGFDVLDKIADTETNPGDRPKEDVIMKIKVIK